MQHCVKHVARRVVVSLALLVATACAPDGPRAVVHTAAGARTITLEVADTPRKHARGLMYRRELAEGHGMLFVFDEETDHSFWMKNTFILLDMIFVGGDGRVVGVHARAKPHSLAPISVGRPSRWVIEVPGGWAEQAGVAAGDRVELVGVP